MKKWQAIGLASRINPGLRERERENKPSLTDKEHVLRGSEMQTQRISYEFASGVWKCVAQPHSATQLNKVSLTDSWCAVEAK